MKEIKKKRKSSKIKTPATISLQTTISINKKKKEDTKTGPIFHPPLRSIFESLVVIAIGMGILANIGLLFKFDIGISPDVIDFFRGGG